MDSIVDYLIQLMNLVNGNLNLYNFCPMLTTMNRHGAVYNKEE